MNLDQPILPKEYLEVIQQISVDLDMSCSAVMRQMVRHYQLVHERIKKGETFRFSGDAERMREFAGGIAKLEPNKSDGPTYEDPMTKVSEWFGENVTKLSVPGTKNGKQIIAVEIGTDKKFEVSSGSIEGAWQLLKDTANQYKEYQRQLKDNQSNIIPLPLT